MQLAPIQKSKSGIGVFILCLFLSIAIVIFLLIPKYFEFSKAKTAESRSGDALALLVSQQDTVKGQFEKVKEQSDLLAKADLAVPNQPGIPELYAYFESLAKSLNLTINTIQAVDESDIDQQGSLLGITANTPGAADMIKSTAPSPTLSVINIDFQVSGAFKDYITFLGKLQNSLRIIDVQSINIAGNTGKPDLTFITNLKTYYQKGK